VSISRWGELPAERKIPGTAYSLLSRTGQPDPVR
jgi:hypothetical protein